MPHFILSRMKRLESSYRWSTFHYPPTRTAFPLFIGFRVKKKEWHRLLFIALRSSLRPLAVYSREEHLSIAHMLGRAHIRWRARSKSFNAVVLSRLIKFPSILRISPMQLNRNSRLWDRSREPTIRNRGERKIHVGRKEVHGNDERSRKKCADSTGFVGSARTRPCKGVDTRSLHGPRNKREAVCRGNRKKRAKRWMLDRLKALTKVRRRSNTSQ